MTTPSVPPIALAGHAEWKLVPVKPTADMAKAGMDQWDRTFTQHDLYVAMVNAAPSPSASSVPVALRWPEMTVSEAHEAAYGPVTEKMLTAAAGYLPDHPYAGWKDDARAMFIAMMEARDAAPPANPAPSVLTDEQIIEISIRHIPIDMGTDAQVINFARAILQANGATK